MRLSFLKEIENTQSVFLWKLSKTQGTSGMALNSSTLVRLRNHKGDGNEKRFN